MTDLNAMSLKELRQLRKDVDKAISSFEARKKKEALAELEAKATELGFSLSELAKASKKLGTPKFRNPDNKSQTWSGRGRQPEWFKDALKAGKSREELKV